MIKELPSCESLLSLLSREQFIIYLLAVVGIMYLMFHFFTFTSTFTCNCITLDNNSQNMTEDINESETRSIRIWNVI